MTRCILTALLVLLAATAYVAQADDDAAARTPDGVQVYEAASGFTFKLLEDARWNGRTWGWDKSGYGAGIGLRKDGWILTTAHQLDDADSLHVVCPDGITRKADIWYWANGMDIGVVHVPDYEVPVPTFAPRAPRVGEAIYAMGHPVGFDNTLVAGIVNGLHRQFYVNDKLPYVFQDYIQMDAQVNSGHSGGPLLDRRGRVVGLINASLAKVKSDLPGMCFGLPIDVALPMARRILEERRAFAAGGLDMSYAAASGMPPDVRAKHGIQSTRGAVIFDLGKDAHAQGLRAADIVLRVDDTPVESWMHLRVLLALRKPGTKTVLAIERAGKRKDVEVTIRTWKESD